MTYKFYQQKIIEINELIKFKKYNQAYQVLQEELKMPYIPSEYIEKFQLLEQKLNKHLKKNIINNSDIPLNKIISMLYGNEKEQEIALLNLHKYNLRIVKNQLKQRIEFWNDNFKKAFLYEILTDQNIDIDIKINNKIMNPSKFSILKNKKIYEIFEKIKSLAFKKPYLIEPAFNELKRYLFISFPNLETNKNNLGLMIFNVVDSMFTKQKKLTSEEQKIKAILKLK